MEIERYIFEIHLIKLIVLNKPKSVPGKKLSSLSVCHETTDKKSATNDGISHFNTAAFPRIIYALLTSVS